MPVVEIGVTGHRVLTELDRLVAGLEVVVDRLEAAFPGEWTVVSALAEGADRLATRRLLDHDGTKLTAVLPLPRDDYEADFTSSDSRREFDGLLRRAGDVVEVPVQPNRDAAYEAGGVAMLERADVVIAVWDGRPAQGLGGTGGIVAEVRRRELPLAWIHAGNRKPGTGEPTSLGAEQGVVTFERFPDAP